MNPTIGAVLLAALAVCAARPLAAQDERAELVEAAIVRSVTGAARGVDVYLLEDPREAPNGAWYALAGRTPAGRLPPTLHACVVEDPAAPRVTCARLPTPGVARAEEPFSAESLAVADLDGDGSPELLAVVNYQGAFTRPGVGSDFDRLFIVNLEARARLAFALDTRRYTESTARTLQAEWSFADEDGDGHNDVVVEQTVCVETASGEGCAPSRRAVYTWRRRTDIWVLAPGR